MSYFAFWGWFAQNGSDHLVTWQNYVELSTETGNVYMLGVLCRILPSVAIIYQKWSVLGLSEFNASYPFQPDGSLWASVRFFGARLLHLSHMNTLGTKNIQIFGFWRFSPPPRDTLNIQLFEVCCKWGNQKFQIALVSKLSGQSSWNFACSTSEQYRLRWAQIFWPRRNF